MAYSSTLYSNQNAGKRDFTLVFSGFGAGYIDSSHVKLYRNDVLQDGGFTFTDETHVLLTTPTVAGENILFRRETPKDAPLVDFELDTALTDTDLDTISLQMLYIAHEVLDGYITLGSAGYTSFNSRRLTDVGNGTLGTDGVNLAQVISLINDKVRWSAVEADEILKRLITVDGDGSCIDADLLDGHHAGFFATSADMAAAEEDIEALQELSVSSSVTYTIGAGGDFATYSAAFTFLADKHPIYTPSGVTVTLRALSGHIVREQILIHGRDFSWVTLTSADSVVYIDPTYLTTEFTTFYGVTTYPCIGVRAGGVGPHIACTFRFSSTTPGTNKCGIVVAGPRSSIMISGGCTYADFYNLAIIYGACVHSPTGSYSYAGDTNIYCSSATLTGGTITATYAGGSAIYAAHSQVQIGYLNGKYAGGSGALVIGGYVSLTGAALSNAGSNGLLADSGAIVRVYGATIHGCGGSGISVNNGRIHAPYTTITATINSAISASRGSVVDAMYSNCATTSPYEYQARSGSTIIITGYTGDAACNVTINSPDAAHIGMVIN